ncbi:alpha/beta-hydrolase [Mycena floridula]|nr:alpha/beta-hydrolase [Mycena floridula]
MSVLPTVATNPKTMSAFIRPAMFSRVAYCPSPAVSKWNCKFCGSLGPNVKILQSGGDGGHLPRYFIAHDKDAKTIVVAHEGTEPTKFQSVLNDIKFLPKALDGKRFKSSAGLGIKVHTGFQDTFQLTADIIYDGVKKALASTKTTKVLVTGHSLGAAISSMDAVMLRETLPASIQITTVVFANYVDVKLGKSLTRITNQQDPVPLLPPRELAFRHPSNEIWIKSVNVSGVASGVTCPGQENAACDGRQLSKSKVRDHTGPYFNGISLGPC